MFGLISSPFLLNGKLKLHFAKLLFKDLYGSFVIEKILSDLEVEYLVSSFNDENLVCKLYEGACNILIQGGFQRRKWITNFESLQEHINVSSCEVNYEIYIKKVLGKEWDYSKYEFIFMFSDIIENAESLPVTKRNILKISVKFLDLL